jgi:hypothetical protein
MSVVTGKEGVAKKFASFPRTQSLLVTTGRSDGEISRRGGARL